MSDREWQIEMLWDCKIGHKRQLGRHQECQVCGKPKTEADEYYMPDDPTHAPEVTDAAMLEDAHAGANYTCRFCGCHERRNDDCCKNCGASQEIGDRDAVKADEQERFDAINHPTHPEKETPPSTSFGDGSGGSRFKGRTTPKKLLGIAGGILGAVFLAFFLVWLFTPVTKRVSVQSVQWTHTAHIDKKQIVRQSGFSEDEPGDAFNVQDQGLRYHHADHVRTGSHTEYYTASESCGQTCTPVPRVCRNIPKTCSKNCTSNKNGYATCRESCTGGGQSCTGGGQSCTTKYCDVRHSRTVDDYIDVPRMRNYYYWSVWRWLHDRDVPLSGTTTDTRWPTADDEHLNQNLGTDEEEKEVGRDATYTVILSDGKEQWTQHPGYEGEFKRFPIGSKWTLSIDHLGIVHSTTPR